VMFNKKEIADLQRRIEYLEGDLRTKYYEMLERVCSLERALELTYRESNRIAAHYKQKSPTKGLSCADREGGISCAGY